MDLVVDRLKKFREILSWSGMKILWIILPLLGGVFAISYGHVPFALKSVVGGLIFGVLVAVFVATYRSAKIDKEVVIERNELRSILFALEDGVIIYDRNFRVIFFNPAAEKIFRVAARDVLDRELKPQDVEREDVRLLIQVVFPSLAPGVVSKTMAGEHPQISELSFTEPTLELRVMTSPVSDENGTLLAFMKIVRDRTREITIIKSKNEFLTIASHQLRTPLTELRWAIESLIKEEGMSDTAKMILEGAQKGSNTVFKIVEDLLNISRIEEGRFGYNFKEADLAEFIEMVLEGIVPVARRAGVKVYFEKPKIALPKVLIDKDKLLLAANNLLENAIRYNTENGQVVVGVEEAQNGQLVVSIEDTGIGIAQDDLKNLFTKFFRAENALRLRTEGSGLGLYITKNIIQAHGGKISAESEIGRGTTFRIFLPTDPNMVPRKEIITE